MAIVNVYGFTINLRSKQLLGDHVSTAVTAVAANAAAAKALIVSTYGADLQPQIQGPTLLEQGVNQ